MKSFQDQEFECFYDRDSGAVFCDLEFRKCHFVSSSISITEDPALRSTVRNVRLIECHQHGCALEAAIVEEVLVDNFKTHGQTLQTWGAVFKHVVLKGEIDFVMISSVVDIYGDKPSIQRAFDEANAAYYKNVDWALDISQGEFKDIDLRGVPGRLIRRDAETQVLVTRKRALEGGWRELPFEDGLWPFTLEKFLETGASDTVLVAAKRHRKFRARLHDLNLLVKAGVAER